MARQKTPREERAVILGQPAKRPYGVKVRIHLQTAGSIGDVQDVCVSLDTGAFLSIAPTRTAPWEGGKKYIVTLEGFPTAASAEASGRRLVQALLWMAVSVDVPLRLEYLSYEPASVFERNQCTGSICEGYCEVGYAPNVVLGELQEAYELLKEPNEKLLLSLEIFCAARLESSQRAVFLAVVSALEPLAQQAPLGEAVDQFVAECKEQVKASIAIPQELRASLLGRLDQLRRESIMQALRRLARDTLPNQPEAPAAIEEAYALRSQLIHNGVPADLDIDLERESRTISAIIRDIYANVLNRSLASRSNG